MPVNTQYSSEQIADILSVSKSIIYRWEKNNTLIPKIDIDTGNKFYDQSHLIPFKQAHEMLNSRWDDEIKTKPLKEFTCLELFAGGGGLAIGLEKAGFKAKLLSDIDRYACQTLKHNRPDWRVIEGDVSQIDFKPYKNKIDLLSGGFPCQAFSYAGNKLGFEDTRGTLFFEFGRALKESSPKIFLAENVKGLASHDSGRTLETITRVLSDLGYTIIEPRILKAIFYQVPQKRERLIIIGIRNDLVNKATFSWPSPYHRIMSLKDGLKKGILYEKDVPVSDGQKYPPRKAQILGYVPQGGYWKDLPDILQREYMQKSYFLGGGKTGIARRLSWEEPSLTLTCSPAQKQTERCHPEENRPLTVREYARIQTFMDSWEFKGSISNQYKQIGNAVPINLAYAIGRSLVRLLNEVYKNS
jgi:DNA (cytosine-5)-methyltransferase 1